MKETDLAALTPGHFEALNGQTLIMILPEGGRIDLELWKVRVSDQHLPRGFRRQFAVEFRTFANGPDHQGTYHLEHPELGAMALFLAPVQPGSLSSPEAKHYEAVFG